MPLRRFDTAMPGGAPDVFYSSAATNYMVETPDGVLYFVCIDLDSDVCFFKSTDGGRTWEPRVVVNAGTTTYVSVWYDRWSGIAAGKIHIAYIDAVSHDVKYRSINTESADTVSAEVTVFNGASTTTQGALSITLARSGYVYILACIDAGVESEWARSVDSGVNWTYPTDTGSFESAADDQWILMPGFGADSNDIICLFWDASANEISRKLWDNSAGSWSETSIATSMTDLVSSTGVANFSAVADLENSRVVLTAWSASDLATAALRCWTITEGAIVEKTAVIPSSGDDQGLCALSIDPVTGYWYVCYAGTTAGGETWSTALKLYYRVSTDLGVTWGGETALTTFTTGYGIRTIKPIPRLMSGQLMVYWQMTANHQGYFNVPVRRIQSSLLIGF